jgi:hypothetical protein
MIVLSGAPSAYQKLLPSCIQWAWTDPPRTKEAKFMYAVYRESGLGLVGV